MNLANKLTLLRILLVPLFIACFYIPLPNWNVYAAAVFIIASVTDIFDGRYARKHNVVTSFGKLMDPIADKLLTVSAIVMLVWWGRLLPVIAVIIIARELIISGFRLIAVQNGTVIAASWIGKLKTVLQCVAISLVLLENPIFSNFNIPFDDIVMYLAAIVTLWSGIDYIYKNRKLVNLK